MERSIFIEGSFRYQSENVMGENNRAYLHAPDQEIHSVPECTQDIEQPETQIRSSENNSSSEGENQLLLLQHPQVNSIRSIIWKFALATERFIIVNEKKVVRQEIGPFNKKETEPPLRLQRLTEIFSQLISKLLIPLLKLGLTRIHRTQLKEYSEEYTKRLTPKPIQNQTNVERFRSKPNRLK